MLDGKYGRIKQIALKRIVKYAEVLGAEKLCEVTKASYHSGYRRHNHVTQGDYFETNSRFYMGEEFDFSEFQHDVLSFTDAEFTSDEHAEEVWASPEFILKNDEFLKIAAKEGMVLASTSAPYLSGWIPTRGEHFVATESSNVLFCNSVFSAMSNSEGNPTNFASILCGRTPEWGNHIWEERYGTHIFYIQCKHESIYDWDIMGHAIGRMMPNRAIPVLVGDFGHVSMEKLKQLFSTMATTSSAEMCHIVGVTPEARTLEEALGNKQAQSEIFITEQDIEYSLNIVCAPGTGPVDYVSLGCPHMSIEELRTASRYIAGKKVKAGVTLHLWTSLAMKALCDKTGYTQTIEEVGGHLLSGSCPLKTSDACFCPGEVDYHTGIIIKNRKGIVFDAAKQAHYLKSDADAPIYYGDMFKSLDAAISGRWEGR